SARPKKAAVKKKAAAKVVSKKTTAKAKAKVVTKKKVAARTTGKAVAKSKVSSKPAANKRVVTRSSTPEVIGAGKMPRVITRGGVAAVQTKSGFPFTVEQIPNGVKEAAFLHSYRKSAWSQFEKLPLPSTNDEAWRRTDIRQLKRSSMKIADSLSATEREALPAIPAQ